MMMVKGLLGAWGKEGEPMKRKGARGNQRSRRLKDRTERASERRQSRARRSSIIRFRVVSGCGLNVSVDAFNLSHRNNRPRPAERRQDNANTGREAIRGRWPLVAFILGCDRGFEGGRRGEASGEVAWDAKDAKI